MSANINYLKISKTIFLKKGPFDMLHNLFHCTLMHTYLSISFPFSASALLEKFSA